MIWVNFVAILFGLRIEATSIVVRNSTIFKGNDCSWFELLDLCVGSPKSDTDWTVAVIGYCYCATFPVFPCCFNLDCAKLTHFYDDADNITCALNLQVLNHLDWFKRPSLFANSRILGNLIEFGVITEVKTVIIGNRSEFLVCQFDLGIAHSVDFILCYHWKEFGHLLGEEGTLNLCSIHINHVNCEEFSGASCVVPFFDVVFLRDSNFDSPICWELI